MNEKTRDSILKIIGLLFMLGGIIRLFATETVFDLLQMKEVWINHDYFIYIYRILGAFVLVVGMLLFSISKNTSQYTSIISVFKWGFIIIGLVMMVTGFIIALPVYLFVLDFVFCFGLAVFLHFSY